MSSRKLVWITVNVFRCKDAVGKSVEEVYDILFEKAERDDPDELKESEDQSGEPTEEVDVLLLYQRDDLNKQGCWL